MEGEWYLLRIVSNGGFDVSGFKLSGSVDRDEIMRHETNKHIRISSYSFDECNEIHA
jgi:hypothetical protein